MNYGMSKSVGLSFEDAVGRVTEELKKEGFGILTTIDLKETLKAKLGVEIGRYTILGACNPPFAFEALRAEPEIGLFLPCNVVVYERQGETIVTAFDTDVMAKIIPKTSLQGIAAAVKERLQRVLNALP